MHLQQGKEDGKYFVCFFVVLNGHCVASGIQSNRFQAYDYGTIQDNMAQYGTPYPLPYNLSAIDSKVPILVVHGGQVGPRFLLPLYCSNLISFLLFIDRTTCLLQTTYNPYWILSQHL